MASEITEKPATERQQRILQVIRTFTAEHGYPPSVREIGERVGLSSSSTIHAHLKALERRGLISRDPTKPRALRPCGGSATPDVVVLPVLGRVAAGVPITAQEDVEGDFVLAAEFAPRGSDSFMLRVKGDSMIGAAILDGDLIMVRPQRTANNGEIVVAMLDGEATVKRFYREPGRIRLQPENEAMAPIYASDVEIVGRVEALVRRI
ncbi:MAG: transcriptional repressor LexA [Candidatus Eremiobacteraeota bacterium]|nr:transcriptional repressor LexA [Candidatus Eremiobacteraeota bacterium]MBV9056565.1 transcriptional repressor LexA [Candidatus Eremiobacteraeota bacterium]MBV9700696.1 transcriptional repressor LexA [Candidatus Eremiobacteraeota bacterium]